MRDTFELNCPTCGYKRKFKDKYALNRATKKTKCNRCCRSKNLLKVIGLVNENFTKNCPKCGKEQKYTDASTYYRSLSNNIVCGSCREFSEEHKRKLSIARNKRIISKESYDKRSKTLKLRFPNGVKKSKESIQRTVDGLTRWRIENPSKERERIKKTRISLLNKYGTYFVNGGGPLYNKNACKIFDRINKELNWQGIHAENNNAGEFKLRINDYLQFYIDYYEPTKNVVIEYNEPHHYKKSYNKSREKIRETHIKSNLHCDLYILKYDENIDDFIKVLKDKYDRK
jgi:hypothetical protein